MPELGEKPQAAKGGEGRTLPSSKGGAFRRAEDLLAIDNERAGAAFVDIEGREAGDRPSDEISDSDALTQGLLDDHSDEDKDVANGANDEVDDALDEKAREEGVIAANDISRTVLGLTHNL